LGSAKDLFSSYLYSKFQYTSVCRFKILNTLASQARGLYQFQAYYILKIWLFLCSVAHMEFQSKALKHHEIIILLSVYFKMTTTNNYFIGFFAKKRLKEVIKGLNV